MNSPALRTIIGLLVLSLLLGFNCSNPSVKNTGQDPVLRIGLVADPQYEDLDPRGTRFYRESLWKLHQAIDSFNYHKVNFVQSLGDIINGKWESFDSILPVYGHLMPHINNYHLLGNHEFAVDEKFKSQLLSKLHMPDFYYSYSLDGWRFIVLDGTDYMEASLPIHPGHEEKLVLYMKNVISSNDHEYNGAIGPVQQKWLKEKLDSAEMKDEKVIIFCHMPVRSASSTSENLLNDFEILSLVEQYPCVNAFICGHYHKGGFIRTKGVAHITLKGMIENQVSSFAIMEIYEKEIRIRGFGDQEDYRFEIE